MKSSNFLCLLTLVVGMNSTAFAGGPVTLTVGAAGVVLDGDRDIDNDVMPALGLQYRFNEKWAMEVLGMSGEVQANPCLSVANIGFFCETFVVENWQDFRSINRYNK